jgi:hypothetical protein
MATVLIDGRAITDGESFHAAFKEAFGFPDFYGRNMDAWIDCVSSLDCEESGLSRLTIGAGERVFIEFTGTEAFNSRTPELFDALVECSAFVNERYVGRGKLPAIALVFL